MKTLTNMLIIVGPKLDYHVTYVHNFIHKHTNKKSSFPRANDHAIVFCSNRANGKAGVSVFIDSHFQAD